MTAAEQFLNGSGPCLQIASNQLPSPRLNLASSHGGSYFVTYSIPFLSLQFLDSGCLLGAGLEYSPPPLNRKTSSRKLTHLISLKHLTIIPQGNISICSAAGLWPPFVVAILVSASAPKSIYYHHLTRRSSRPILPFAKAYHHLLAFRFMLIFVCVLIERIHPAALHALRRI